MTPGAEQARANGDLDMSDAALAASCPPSEQRPMPRRPRPQASPRDPAAAPRWRPAMAPVPMGRVRMPPNPEVDATTGELTFRPAGRPRGPSPRGSPRETSMGMLGPENIDALFESGRPHAAAFYAEAEAAQRTAEASATTTHDRPSSLNIGRDYGRDAIMLLHQQNLARHALSQQTPSGVVPQDTNVSHPTPSLDVLPPRSVRWPITSDISTSRLLSHSGQARSSHSRSASGVASTEEQTLQRTYRAIQEETSRHQLYNRYYDFQNFAQRASARDWTSTHESAASRMAERLQEDREAGVTAADFLAQYGPNPGANNITEPVVSLPTTFPIESNEPRLPFMTSIYTPEKDDYETELPPLTPQSTSELEDYGFRAASRNASSSISEDTADGAAPLYRPLKSQGFGRYQPSHLHSGAVYVGSQSSERQVYNVKVQIKHVDMDASFMCGHLIIEGLTPDHPKLETYFEGEIIGSKYTFHTRHPSWGASEKQDMLHWNRFAAWKPIARAARKTTDFASTYADFAERENIFMRWKEYFLVPDHRVTAISGASFEGFYYICFNQKRGSFSGIYYHSKSERKSRWQQLELEYVYRETRGTSPAIEMA